MNQRRIIVLACLIVTICLGGFGIWVTSHPNNSGETTASQVVLDQDKQKFIWDAEHITFEVETYVGKPFAKALQQKDRERLLSFFHRDFHGEIPKDTAPVIERRQGIVTEDRRDIANSPRVRIEADGIVDFLMNSLTDFSEVQRSKFRVLQIDQVDQSDKHWKIQILITADGKQQDGELIALESMHRAELQFDNDSEIAQGKIIRRWEAESEVLLRCPRPLMEEVTDQVGLSKLPLPDNWDLPASDRISDRYQVAVEDFDRDGFLDIAVAVHPGIAPRPKFDCFLLRSVDGERYEDVTSMLDAPPQDGLESNFVAWIDYDNDGFPDLIMFDRLYHNMAGKKFANVTVESGLEFKQMPFGCSVVDYDADGRLDLYLHSVTFEVGRQSTGPTPWVGDHESGTENELWRNMGDGRFRNVTAESGTSGGLRHTFASAWFFYDDDRFPDLYLANDFGTNLLLRNRGDGTFEDVSDSAGVTKSATSMGVVTGDLNNDGATEIYVANMYSKMGRRIISHVCAEDYPPGVYEQLVDSCAGNQLYRLKSGTQRYQEISQQVGVNDVGWAYGPAMVDLDGDGWLDLYATTGYMSFDRQKPDG